MNRVYQIIIVLLLIAVGYLLLQSRGDSPNATSSGFQKASKEYPYLSARILQEYHNDILINFLGLRKQLRQDALPYADTFALYFEYLPSGTSIGINEKQEFSAASLFKVPIVMAYYHKKERLGITRDPEVTIKPDQIDKKYGTLWQKGVGARVEIKDAIEKALTESDNTAAVVVGDQVGQEDFEPIYEGLDIDLKVENETGAVITAKQFSSVLKALYFSSVLTKGNSNLILDYLSKSKFQNQIPAGVPSSVKVAHKIGIVEGRLYSDCGIIYVPKRPYLLCMISASDEATANTRMQKISKDVYDYVSKANK